ncbi:cilia- and flagella-associated protein 97-like [Vespa mandarinia]|uniref:cilia- and flagella-associated protein 97-like n=1 Tax=Vespa mandarinia TaxID=7446 RepID=UPI00162199E1|nr:cilia- and flagella-associated protein 97-like [Vespa mandarinia]
MTMSNLQDVKTNYLCQCTLSITDEIVSKQISETKDNFNNVPSIHEVDENDDDDDDDDNCETNIINSTNLQDIEDHETEKDKEKNTLEDEFAYTNESFCSDDSCDESEETTSQYLISGSCSLFVNDDKYKENEKLENVNDKEKEIFYNRESKESINVEKNGRIWHNNEKNIEFGKTKIRRKNMSFTDEEVRKIEHENELLLRKIMAQHQPRDKVFKGNILPKMSSSAINRKRLQKKIEGDNMILLRRIQQAKPCVIPKSTAPGYRMTFI